MIFKVEDINDTKAVERLGPEKNVYHMNNYAVVSQRTKGKFASKLLKGSRTGVILFTSKYLAHYKWAYWKIYLHTYETLTIIYTEGDVEEIVRSKEIVHIFF